jgi:hypothetical protein
MFELVRLFNSRLQRLDVYPGELFPLGPGRVRGPWPKPSALTLAGACNALKDNLVCGSALVEPFANASNLCFENSAQNARTSARASRSVRRLLCANRAAKSLRLLRPSHQLHSAAAVVLSVQRAPVVASISSAPPSSSSQITLVAFVHFAAMVRLVFP